MSTEPINPFVEAALQGLKAGFERTPAPPETVLPATQQAPIDGALLPTAEQAACLQDLADLQERKRNPHKEYVARLRANLPKVMLEQPRFVRWFQGTTDTAQGSGKILRGKVNDPNTWSSLDECVAALTPKDAGLGYVFTDGDIYGLDLDHVRNATTGELCPEAKVILSRFNSYADVSPSGTGLHILFTSAEEITRYKKLGGGHVEFWHPRHSPRFFTLSGDLVPGYNTLRDGREAFLFVGGTLTHTNARLREEIQTIDPEQAAKLHQLKQLPEETAANEKPKRKTRVVKTDFTIKDYLSYNRLKIINECDNEVGHCLRVDSCPIKGEAHAGHNNTTCNFIYPTTDGGFAFKCYSTGCQDIPTHEVVKKLADLNGVYEKGIYEDKIEKPKSKEWIRTLEVENGDVEAKTHLRYLWQDYLPLKKLIHFAGASGAGKSPVSLDIAARISAGQVWPDGSANTWGPRSVILMCSEDDWGDTVRPRLELYGADLKKIKRVKAKVTKDDTTLETGVALKEDLARLVVKAATIEDLALVIIDPITNYLQGVKMNSEEEVRSVLMPLVEQFITPLNVSVITIGHLNRREKGTEAKARVMGAAAFYGVARFVYMFGPDKDLEDKFAHVMAQDRGVGAQSIKYKTEAVDQTWDGETGKVVRVVWGEKCDADAQDAVDPISTEEKNQITEDADFLKEFLRDGAKPAQAVQQAHEQKTGRKVANWDKAKRRAKVSARKIKGQGRSAGWEWGLIAPEQAEFDHNKRA